MEWKFPLPFLFSFSLAEQNEPYGTGIREAGKESVKK